MAEHQDMKQRLDDKPARKALAELYGDDATPEAARYLGLAELAERDAAVRDSIARDSIATGLRFYSAPGRTELGGNHTDHNRGRVLCAAVRLDAVACVAPTDDGVVRLVSEGYPDPIVVDLSSLAPVPSERGTTAALVRGVARGLTDYVSRDYVMHDYVGRDKAAGGQGAKLRGFAGRMTSSVLPGSGLSSSASVEVLLGTIMADLAGIEVSAVEIAKIGQFAENEYFGKPCGLMDQAASAVGGISSIDFARPTEPAVQRVEYDFSEKGYDLIVVNTGGNHADLTADYAAIPFEMKAAAAVLGAGYLGEVEPRAIVARGPEIRKACGDRAFLRAMHFVAENERVAAMAKALEDDRLDAYLELVKESGRSSWEQLQNVYAPSVPSDQGLSVALSLTEKYVGGRGAWRVHGGGFAGTIQAYVPSALKPGYVELMTRYFGAGSVIPLSVRDRGALKVAI